MATFTSNITKVDSSITNVILLDEGFNRHMVTIYNNSTFSLYIKYGEGATADSFTLRISSGDYLELPTPCYTGRIDGFWEGADGNAMITKICQ
jgi:hypothetical protein